MGRRAAVVGAVDGALARAPVHALRGRRGQCPRPCSTSRSRPSSAAPPSPTAATTSAASTSARTTCAAFDWDPFAYERDLREAMAFLAARCERTLTATIPLDLGRPRAGAKVRDANAIIERCARETGALVVDLAGFRGRRVLMADHVHPTAFGQVAIAERALAVLERDGLTVRTRPRELVSPPSPRAGGALRGDATYLYRHAKVSARRRGRQRLRLATAARQAARASAASSVTWRRRANSRRAPTSSARERRAPAASAPRLAVALEEGVALEQRRAGEVGLGDEPARRQFAVENLKGSRWSGSRWSGSRWSGSRWSGSRWSSVDW